MTTVLPFRTAALRGARAPERVLPLGVPRRGGRVLPSADGALAFLTAAALAPWDGPWGFAHGASLLADAALAGVWVTVLWARGSYERPQLPRLAAGNIGRILSAAAAIPLTAVLVAALLGSAVDAPRLALLTALTATLTAVGHGVADRARARSPQVRAVLAGHPHGVRRMLADIDAAEALSVVAICVTEPAEQADFDAPLVTGLDNVRACAAEHGADAVVVVPCHHVEPEQIRRVGWDLESAGAAAPELYIATGLHDVGPGRAHLASAGPVPVVRVRQARTNGAVRAAKTVGERVVAAAGLVALIPLLLLLAVLVRLESPGPAVFRQTRVGKDGVPFTMLKLRTMCADAAELQASLSARTPAELMLFKMHADPRITRLGRFLRTYSLDELPQLVNVVRGQMALIGPRPALPCEVERYDADAYRRLAVTPGMTGLWQVSGRSDLSWEESLQLDLRYVDDWSPGLDLQILARTLGAVVGHRGAY